MEAKRLDIGNQPQGAVVPASGIPVEPRYTVEGGQSDR